MTDGAGQVIWSADFKPFGETISITGTGAITNNLRFPGQYYDAETGLHYNYRRDYSTALGRYLEKDPIGNIGGKNHLYAYVGNNPITTFDPFGLADCSNVLRLGTIGVGAILEFVPGAQFIGATIIAGTLLTIPGDTSIDASNAKRLPPGSLPIDQTPWSGDHQVIKPEVGARPDDKVWISPDDHVWTQNPDGTYEDHGPADAYTGSGKASGRSGKDRDKKRRGKDCECEE